MSSPLGMLTAKLSGPNGLLGDDGTGGVSATGGSDGHLWVDPAVGGHGDQSTQTDLDNYLDHKDWWDKQASANLSKPPGGAQGQGSSDPNLSLLIQHLFSPTNVGKAITTGSQVGQLPQPTPVQTSQSGGQPNSNPFLQLLLQHSLGMPNAPTPPARPTLNQPVGQTGGYLV